VPVNSAGARARAPRNAPGRGVAPAGVRRVIPAGAAQRRFGNAGTAALLGGRETVRRAPAPGAGPQKSGPGTNAGGTGTAAGKDQGMLGEAADAGVDLLQRVANENSLTMAAVRLLIPDGLLAQLRQAMPALRYAAGVLASPASFLKIVKNAIGRRIVDSVKGTTSFLAGLVPSTPNFDGKACVEAQLNLALKEVYENWWDVLVATLYDIVWPFPGIADDFTEMWKGLKSAWHNLWNGDIDAVADDLLFVLRHNSAAAGRIYPWFAVVALIIGAFTGPYFAAVAEAVKDVGTALLIATLAIEALSIAKAAANMANPARPSELKECDCRIIAQSALTLALMGAFSLLGAGAKLLVQTLIKRVSFLWVKRLRVRRGGKPNSSGDIMARRLALALRLKSAFNRYRVAITDQLGLGHNFPGIDIAVGSELIFKVRATGEILNDLAAVQKALAEGKRLDLTIDRGEVLQVKSYSKGKGDAARQDAIFKDISKEMGKFAEFKKGKTYFGPQHNVVLTNIERRTFVVFLQKNLPSDLLAQLRVLAESQGVDLQPIVGAVPPGHPSLIAVESLPQIIGQLGPAAAGVATENGQQPVSAETVECKL
jgi:hypothetical protein